MYLLKRKEVIIINALVEKEDIEIENMIYEIKGKQVMLVSDIAKIYNTETKIVNQTIKRNIERFPEDFCFQLTDLEWASLRSQIVTSKNNSNKITRGGIRYLPYVLTEHGIIMLSGLLNSDIAIEMNIRIINAFVKMRKYISSDLMEHRKMLINHENRLTLIENTFDNFKEKNNHLFFEGQIYDAYSLMLNIFDKSKESIIIIDNYIDKNILDILSKTNKQVTLITNKYKIQDYEKYREQYNNVTLVIDNSFHDRFIIIDKEILYHSGASFKDLGKKCFSITKIEDTEILHNLLDKLK